MTNEQLQNGAKLAEQIATLEAQLLGWKTAKRFYYKTISLYSETGKCYDKINPDYVDFEVVKTLTIARIEKELSKLKTEFENL